MLNQKMQDALNKQMNAEIYSAYLYFSMSAYFESKGLKGFANWMRIQAQEEMTHALKFYHYILERGGKVVTQAIDAPPAEWKSVLNVFEHTYKHEQKVSSLINELLDLASGVKDHATHNFLQWFIAEQVEEESSADDIVQKLKLAGNAQGALFMLDNEFKQRVFTAPVQENT